MRNSIYFILLFVSILFLIIFKNVKTSEGVFVWETWYRISQFKCLKEKYSKEFVIVPATYYETGKVSLNAELNIINARAAGIENVDIYFSPCIKPSSASELVCGDARESIIFVLDHLNKNNAKFGRFWLYIYGLTDCNQYDGWNEDNKTKNIEYIDEMVNTLKERNQPFGFFTNKYNWHEITGNTRKYNNTPLLYYNVDQKDNFDDYNEYGYPFGGWEKPTIKEYNFTTICDINVANLLQI
uniref:Candidate secreted effector n=1 Tax=Meloidogyne incognita TaxID=6306 RepID=A0A914KVS2_MELIC